jgi:phosphoenolpyruvate-protein phosphotransferase (PTS system enzyme I)
MKTERRFQGVAVSPGIARGAAYVYRPEDDVPPRRAVADVEGEIQRLNDALAATRKQISDLHSRMLTALGAKDAAVFEAHLMFVEDDVLIGEVHNTLRAEKCNAEHAYWSVMQRYARSLGQMEDSYLRERSNDIQDVARRVVHNLMGKEVGGLAALASPHVVLAHNLTPSDTAQLNRENVLGFGTEAGGRTSHTAILARSLAIPAVVGLHNALDQFENGCEILLDGYSGLIIANPSEQTLFEYGELEVRRRRVESALTELRETESTTRDGTHVILSANIETPGDVAQVHASGAEGVGLFRTEFLYLSTRGLPTEDEQTAAYAAVAAAVKPHSVIIRTLDLGGDKLHETLSASEEENPFLGWRAIRVCLERIDIFKTQLRAILRASAGGSIKLMFPMISGMQELLAAKEVLEECREELRHEGRPFDEKMEVGMMIEVPSAAVIADLLAREVDFFSLGTNDLVQYTLAADRGNERIAHLYEPTHPGVLRLIKNTVDASHAAGIWTGVCGEMGGDIVLTPLLIGLGVDELSCGAAVLPRVKRAVRSLDISACRRLATAALGFGSGADVLARCEAVAREHYGELL